MARPAILKKKSAETNQRDGFSMADTFNLLGRATKIVAVGCVLGAVFGLVAAPTATVTAVGAATLWVAGYAEQACSTALDAQSLEERPYYYLK